MATRWGLGPVFDTERRINARRWQSYAGRSSFVATLLIGMVTIWWSYLDASWTTSIRNQAKIGEAYFYAMIGIQLALTMIVAPATTAGAVCVERSRGSLAHMLVTDLSSIEIILGKLAARLLPMLALIACAWPVAAIGSLLGGINPQYLTMAFAITLSVGLVGCSLSLALSTWAKSIHEVLMAVYTFWGLVLLAYPILWTLSFSLGKSLTRLWMIRANPFWLAFAPYVEPGKVSFWDYFGFFATALGLSALSMVVAIVGVRVNPLGEARPKRRGRAGMSLIGRVLRRLPGPSIDRNPVFWREWHRGRSSRTMRILTTILGMTGTALCIHGTYEIITQGDNIRAGFAGVIAMLVQILFGLLMIGVFASLTFAEERRRGSLDVLLATPLTTRSIVWGKWLGTFRVVPLLAIGPALIAWALAQNDIRSFVATQPASFRDYYDTLSPEVRAFGAALMPLTILAHGAWIASLGLALSIWIRRQSRAISLVVASYIMVTVALPYIFIFLGGPGRGRLTGGIDWLISCSPIMASLQLENILSHRPQDSGSTLIWIAVWDIVAACAALLLFEASVRTFNRSFDRVPEVVRRRGFGRRHITNLDIAANSTVQFQGSSSGHV